MKIGTEFGILLKKKRKAVGLTLRGLAKKVGVSTQTILNWENAVCFPQVSEIPNAIEKLASSLMIDKKEIIVAIEKSDSRSRDILPLIKAIAGTNLKYLTFNHLEQIISVSVSLGGHIPQELIGQISKHIQSKT